MKIYYQNTAYTGMAVKSTRVYLPDLAPFALITSDGYELLDSDSNALQVKPWAL